MEDDCDSEEMFAVGDRPPWTNRRPPETSGVPTLQQMFALAQRMGYEMRPISRQSDAPRQQSGGRSPVGQDRGFRSQPRIGRDYSKFRCFSCGQFGHMQSRCPKPDASLPFRPKKSAGHDKLNSIMYKNLAEVLSHPISLLINKSLSTGIVPNSMKLAKVIPIYKSKYSKLFSNYRPISLLPTLSKLLENVVHRRVYQFLKNKKILYSSQYGFRPGHSTINATTEFLWNTLQSIENNHKTLSVFLDLSKAFDTIDHSILLQKLEHYGIRGLALDWFRSYISDRKQFVSYNNKDSDIMNMNCGVPQGSVLGPLLFIIYTNDVPHCLAHNKAIIFADDTTLFSSGNCVQELFNNMKTDLLELIDWFRANKLSLNLSKTNYVLFRKSTDNTKIENDLSLKIGDETITRASTVKFLGLHIDEHLTWSHHFKNVQNNLNLCIY